MFTSERFRGNPLAVVHDAEGLSSDEMQRFANWTNLSETTFLTKPNDARADYALRIFTPSRELPFAGHPTLGSCHAWRDAGGIAQSAHQVVQQCGAGLITIRVTGSALAFEAPPLIRSGPVDDETMKRVRLALSLPADKIVAMQWVDNGPGWLAILVSDRETLLNIRCNVTDLKIGVVAPMPEGSSEKFEVRAFFPRGDGMMEDPVTGSLNASIAQWFFQSGLAHANYVAAQGTALGRKGRVHLSRQEDGSVWVGGETRTCITGKVDI